jgi:hypothetical protein
MFPIIKRTIMKIIVNVLIILKIILVFFWVKTFAFISVFWIDIVFIKIFLHLVAGQDKFLFGVKSFPKIAYKI